MLPNRSLKNLLSRRERIGIDSPCDRHNLGGRNAQLTLASGTAEPEAALDMLRELSAGGYKTVGGNKNDDTAAFVATARALEVTPHVAQNITAHLGSNIDGHTTRHDGYRVSHVIRKRIVEANGWIKKVGGIAQTKFRGLLQVGWMFNLKAAAYKRLRLSDIGETPDFGV